MSFQSKHTHKTSNQVKQQNINTISEISLAPPTSLPSLSHKCPLILTFFLTALLRYNCLSAFMTTNQNFYNITKQLSVQNFKEVRTKHQLCQQDELKKKINPSDVSLSLLQPKRLLGPHHFPPQGIQELMDKNASKQICWILGRWWCTKHQESVSPSRQKLHWQNLSAVTILELWSLLKACNFQKKP